MNEIPGEPRPTYPKPTLLSQLVKPPWADAHLVRGLLPMGEDLVVAADDGVGKSHFINELAFRVALVGGDAAGMWPIERRAPVCILSEMSDAEDWRRREALQRAFDLTRDELGVLIYRQRMRKTTTSGNPVADPCWVEDHIAWLRDTRIGLDIYDTAQGATGIDPWGAEFQSVFERFGQMRDEVPGLSTILAVHLNQGEHARPVNMKRVMGHWTKRAYGVLLMSRVGRTVIEFAPEKNVRLLTDRFRADYATGLLVPVGSPKTAPEAVAPPTPGEKVTKVSRSDQSRAIPVAPDCTSVLDFAKALGVGKSTAEVYIRDLLALGAIVEGPPGERRTKTYQRPGPDTGETT
jgi:AAA domain